MLSIIVSLLRLPSCNGELVCSCNNLLQSLCKVTRFRVHNVFPVRQQHVQRSLSMSAMLEEERGLLDSLLPCIVDGKICQRQMLIPLTAKAMPCVVGHLPVHIGPGEAAVESLQCLGCFNISTQWMVMYSSSLSRLVWRFQALVHHDDADDFCGLHS